MQLKHRITRDESAVSPVIGVILMVAITVILAAVIASFVLGLGPNTSTTPQATFSSEYDSTNNQLEITMDNGNNIDMTKVSITGSDGDGTDVDETWNSAGGDSNSNSEIVAGSSVTIGDTTNDNGAYTVSDGYEITLIYEDGDTSSTMRTFES